ncbi:hypothetical protein BaRGS_00035029 [Batillaria attramentaria]|uniref:Uncharacterized protein n=1 Tax=Batillaria attramentaria TaxID=370345 RepID=A0ABD0JFF5_9CAEN
MSAGFRGIILISALVWMHLATGTAQECDFTFNIPSLVDSVLNVEEKSNVSFNFTFGSTLCRITDSHVITVAKLDDNLEVTTEPPLSSSDVTTHADFDSTVTVAPRDLTTRDQSDNRTGKETRRGQNDESSEDDTTTATLAAAFSVAICVVVAIFVYSRFRKRNTGKRPGTCQEIPDEGQGLACQKAKVVEEEQPSDDGEQAEMIVNTAYEGGNVSVEHNTTDGNDASDCSLRLLQDNGSLEDSASSASALVSNAAESGAATGDYVAVTDLPKLTTRQMEQGAEHSAAESGAANGDYIAINDIPELTVLK